MTSAAARLAPANAPPGRSAAWAGLGLHQVRYVLAAAECGGFRRAARRLGVQQSAVSRRIQELEDRLGAPIFQRSPSGVRLTAAGREFVHGARGALVELDRAVDHIADLADGRQHVLRLGVLGPLGPGPLDDLLRQALARAPGVSLEIREGSSRDHLDSLARANLDLAFLPRSDHGRDFEVRPAWRERLLVALAPDDALAALQTVRWRDLAGRRLMLPAEAAALGDLVERRWRRAEQRPLLTLQPAGYATVLRLVALGQGAALAPETSAMRSSGVVYRPIRRENLAYDAVMSRRASKPSLRRLIGLIEATWGQVTDERAPDQTPCPA